MNPSARDGLRRTNPHSSAAWGIPAQALSDEQLARLDEVGFVWDALDAAWAERFGELVAYRAAHGDCNVPRGWPENPALASWVNTQRAAHKKGTLSDERQERLDGIACVWDALAAAWEERLGELVAYRAAHGDCNIPAGWPENPALANWVWTQRTAHKKGTLIDERLARLDEIGFGWSPHDAAWEEMFAALVAYREAHGDCNVPAKWREAPSLGRWVSKQRASQTNGTLTPERRKRLDALGFTWSLRREA